MNNQHGGNRKTAADQHLIDLLCKREGLPTKITLNDHRVIEVWNIAWEYDSGDDFAHVSTNVSPRIEGTTFDFFFTAQILKISDAISGEVLFRNYKC